MSPDADSFYGRLQARVPALAVDADAWVQRMMRWHFSEETGSPFWLGRRDVLGFDPIRDVRTLGDIERFGLFDKAALRTVAVGDLVPRGFADKPRRVFETGGTTGAPCRVVDVVKGAYDVNIYLAALEHRGLAGGDILAMTPAGPHAYGTFVGRLADRWCGNMCAIDLDPRWVKALARTGGDAADYVAHLLEQTRQLLASQRFSLLFTTPKLLMALVVELGRPLGEYGIRAVCTGGTSFSDEEERYLAETYLQGVAWIDTYGNTLAGHALQGDPWEGCRHRAYYLPPPQAHIRLVKTPDWRTEVPEGERGQVLIITLHEDLFVPNLLERDTAVRAPPHPMFPFPGVAKVMPLLAEEGAVEGVY